MKKLLMVFFIFIASCSTSKIDKKCFNIVDFDISVSSSEIDKISQKNIFNKIINESSIRINKNSDVIILLNVSVRRDTSLISDNNTVEIENITFITNYELRNKSDNALIDKQRFIIVNDIPISNDRFANYTTNNHIIDNFIKSLIIKLDNRLSAVKNSEKNCKKG